VRILTVHNRYLQRGGEDHARELEGEILAGYGHEADTYLDDNSRINSLGLIRTSLKTIWSQETYLEIRKQLWQKKYDLLNCHNTFPLISPAAYYAAKTCSVAVVQTLHNYRLLCPNAILFREGRVCEDCVGKFFPWPGVVHGCYQGSRAGTAVVATMSAMHRALSTYKDQVDLYIAVSNFTRHKFIEGGLPADKIFVKPNFVHPDPQPGNGGGGYALLVSRLAPEKGIEALLTAWERIGSNVNLKIVGDGPLSSQVVRAANKLSNIEWLGQKSLEEVYQLMGHAAFLIFPSQWYETFGRVAIEAFAKGTPVIASNIGAVAELIDHRRTGLLFDPGDPEDLAAQIEWLLTHPAELSAMRREARAEFEGKYTAQRNYEIMLRLYELAIERSRSQRG
jgi:glycosyltransferase involved in cell wall biosynthesis